MIINRSQIVDGLYHFSQKGNGVIIGNPGIGKSYSIAELSQKLTDNNIPVAILRIDNLPDGTDRSIEAEIEAEGDWISYLDQVKLSNTDKAVLIFDAFDAARNEELRKQILTQIGKAISGLKKWNIIVSVRTYDATKSPQLLRLFGDQNSNGPITCRNYEIPELSRDELTSAFESNTSLGSFYENGPDELKSALRIPFFLRLLEIVLENSNELELGGIRLIKSETELLDKYWAKMVFNTENSYKKELCLKAIANCLVQNRSMSFLKYEFIKDERTFKELRSEDIISEVGIGEKYVAFSHNILFDYIVGRLIIPPEPEELLKFINQDKSRLFFLRPSFIFHFTSLWYNYRKTFWENYNFLGTQKDTNILLFKRLIPTSVIANEFKNIEDLDPIIKDKEVIHQLLQSIRFLSCRIIGSRDIELLFGLVKTFDIRYLWEYAFVFDKILNVEIRNQLEFVEKCGIISRQFLRFILNERKVRPEARHSLDRLGSTRGIEFVSKTFNSNFEESTQLFREVLDLLNEPKFEIWYFSSLSNDIKYFIKDAPDFVSEVYYRIFSHIENSDEKTNMGTVTMNLVSNRRQDFEMCYYRLLQLFPTFLSISSEIAIKTGIKIVNDYVTKEELHIIDNSKSIYTINLKNISSSLLPDLSSMWHDRLDYHKPAQLVDHIINYFKQLVEEKETDQLFTLIEVYISNSLVGFTWKRLIEFGNEYPELLKEYLYQLALNQVILECSDTSYEIGISLQKIFPLLNEIERMRIEEIILKLLETTDKEQKRYAEYQVNKLLNCIPKDLLQTREALNIVTSLVSVKNEPTFKTTWSSEPYTTQKWLVAQGVDLNSETNLEVYNQMNSLEEFNNKWINDKPFRAPIRENFVEFLLIANNLFEQITSQGCEFEKELEFSALKEIVRFYSILASDTSKINEVEYESAKKAIQFGLRYMSKYDVSFDENSSPSSGYSPTPRIEAASALMGLFSFSEDFNILEDIKNSVVDINPIVRFNALRNLVLLWPLKPDVYWEIVFERLTNESDSFTIATVLNNVNRKDIIDTEEKVEKVIKIAATRISEFRKRDSFTRTFVGLLLYLFDNKKNEVARNLIYNNIENTDFIQDLLFLLFDFIDPKYLHNNYSIETTRKELFKLLNDITIRTLEILKKDDPNEFSKNESPERDRLLLIDFIIQRIYFLINPNQKILNKHELIQIEINKKAFYDRIKQILLSIIDASKEIGGGIMIAHTAHYLIETLNGVSKFYPEEARSIMGMTAQITVLSYKTGYTFDSLAIKEVVNLTETIFADHKILLRDEEFLNQLISILNIYVESGWTQALELLWKLDEAFK